MGVETGLLIDHRAAFLPLVGLMEREWPDWYNPRGASARADLNERMRRDGLPMGIVAFVDSAVAGTCALTLTSGGLVTERSPWLGGLLVAPDHRRGGVATALAQRAVLEARRLGYRNLYALTAEAVPLFESLGWLPLDTVWMDGKPHRIFAANS